MTVAVNSPDRTIVRGVDWNTGTALNGLTAMTAAIWVYPTSWPTSGSSDFFTKWSTATAARAWSLYRSGVSATLNFEVAYDGGQSTDTMTRSAAALNNWSHMCGAWSPSTRNVFVDGIPGTANTNARTSITNSTANLWLGNQGDSLASVSLVGNAVFPTVWNVHLTQDEITALAAGAHPLDIRRASIIFHSSCLGTSNIQEITGLGIAGTNTGMSDAVHGPPVAMRRRLRFRGPHSSAAAPFAAATFPWLPASTPSIPSPQVVSY